MEHILQSNWDIPRLGYMERDSMLSTMIKCFENGLEDPGMVELIARFASELDLIMCVVKSPHASAAALMEIANHPANNPCWMVLLHHPNVTSEHMAMILSHPASLNWFEVEKTMALSAQLNDEVAYELLERNALETYGVQSRFPHKNRSDRELILHLLNSNERLSSTFHHDCEEVIARRSLRYTG